MLNNFTNIDEIKQDINRNGFYCINNFINDDEINILRKFVDEKLKENNNQYFFLTSESNSDSLLSDENFFQSIEDLLKKLL